MYTEPSNLEQVLHNNIIVFEALIALHLNLDVQVNTRQDKRGVQQNYMLKHTLRTYTDFKTARGLKSLTYFDMETPVRNVFRFCSNFSRTGVSTISKAETKYLHLSLL